MTANSPFLALSSGVRTVEQVLLTCVARQGVQHVRFAARWHRIGLTCDAAGEQAGHDGAQAVRPLRVRRSAPLGMQCHALIPR